MAGDVVISETLKLLKISSLKAEQKEAVVALLNDKDVMAILPTGYGKSVIFQLFTLMKMTDSSEDSLSDELCESSDSFMFLQRKFSTSSESIRE